MSPGASIVCAAEGKAPGLVAALTAAFRYRVVAVRLADAPAKLAAARPAAIVVADPQADPALLAAIVQQTEELEGPFVPILVHRPADPDVSLPLLPIIDAVPARVVARLAAALRTRTLHATVQRRAAAAARDRNNAAPPHGSGTPTQVTVLAAGRGGSYPALTTAIGEKAGLVGALSFETARHYLDGRDIDGIVVGDGFSTRAIETFLDALRADVRFRDLPIVVADTRAGTFELDGLPNGDHIRGGPDRVLAHLFPLAQLHAFATRLRRQARSLESKGLLDADTGLLTCDAFLRDLARTVEDCGRQAGPLSLARFSFGQADQHASLDAARIIGRLVRTTDFACRDDDGAIHIAFGDTDLKAAHVVARRIASVLKHTMLSPDPDGPRLSPEIALVTRRAGDTARSLLARVHPAAIAAE